MGAGSIWKVAKVKKQREFAKEGRDSKKKLDNAVGKWAVQR